MIAYLCWRVLVGLHENIQLSFMIAGHTRCLVDGCFGLVKQKYRRSDLYTLQQLTAAVNNSASCNVADQDGVVWYEWDKFFDGFFKKVKGISQYHHFTFDSAAAGEVQARALADNPPEAHAILKVDKSQLSRHQLPPVLPSAGLTDERKQYLFKEIRPFVADPYKDELCPNPAADPQ